MGLIQVSKNNEITGDLFIDLPSSKSLSNRALIAAHLGGFTDMVKNVSFAEDTQNLLRLLNTKENSALHTGAGGTTFRFLLCLKALSNWKGIIEGTPSFNKRPVKTLVNALIQLGAQIEYVKNEGFPPLGLNGFSYSGQNHIMLDAGISSQFASALMLISPYLPQGIILHLKNEIVSAPYIRMTADLMQYYGAAIQMEGSTISVSPGKYIPKKYVVENDWSALAFFAEALALLKPTVHLRFAGLYQNSWQGDSKVLHYFQSFGILSEWENDILTLYKSSTYDRNAHSFDLLDEPDLAPALIATSAALGRADHYLGLKTLRIKESDRIAAMQNELAKFGYTLQCNEDEIQVLPGTNETSEMPVIETYDDHRIAMAMAPLATLRACLIRDPDVVSKSFPGFWDQLKKIGFAISG